MGITVKFEEYVDERHRIFNIQDANKECMNINWGSLSLGGEIGVGLVSMLSGIKPVSL